jgi:hypothetical protein
VIKFDEYGGVNLISVFPGVVTFGVPLPFDEVLQGFALPPGPMGTYLFHFVFLFSINQIRWWSGKVWSV